MLASDCGTSSANASSFLVIAKAFTSATSCAPSRAKAAWRSITVVMALTLSLPIDANKACHKLSPNLIGELILCSNLAKNGTEPRFSESNLPKGVVYPVDKITHKRGEGLRIF